MDSIVMIMFGSVLCTMTALNFMELRRIRKKLETKQSWRRQIGSTSV